MKTITLCLALVCAQAAAHGQEIWRCGADGRSYAATPCNDGRTVPIDAARPVADVRAAHAIAVREAGLADQLRRERQQQQASILGSGLGGLSAARAGQAVKAAGKAVARDLRKQRKRQPAAGGTSTAAARATPHTTG